MESGENIKPTIPVTAWIADTARVCGHVSVWFGAVIGRGAIVAAGAVVPPGMVVPPETMVDGVPAKVMGPLDEAKKQLAQRGVDNYVHHKEAYWRGIY